MTRAGSTAIVAAAALMGCVATGPEGSVAGGDLRASAYPPLAVEVPGLLTSEAGDSVTPQVVSLPPGDGWPRLLPDAGPFYALAQFSPYVGQFGVLADWDRADAGYGLGALFGYRLPLNNAFALGLEVQYEFSEHKNPSAGVDAHHTRYGGAVRATFNFDRKLRPFGVVGGGEYRMEFDSVDPKFFLRGLGVFLGGGVDYVHSGQLAIRGEMTIHIWDAAEIGYDKGGTATTLFLGAGAAFSF